MSPVEAVLYADARDRCRPDCWGATGEVAPPKTTRANGKPPEFYLHAFFPGAPLGFPSGWRAALEGSGMRVRLGSGGTGRAGPKMHAWLWPGTLSVQEGGRRQRASQVRTEPSENVLAALPGGLSKVIYHFVHFPSHLCTAGSNGSACVLPSRAKPVPWLRSALAVHSHLLSPPALPAAVQDPKSGVGVYKPRER